MATVIDGQCIPHQFGVAWAFPAEVAELLAADRLVDRSWGNDAMPCVGVPDPGEDGGPLLWCDAADPDDSEFPTREARYFVVRCYDCSDTPWALYIGEDVSEALRVLFGAAVSR